MHPQQKHNIVRHFESIKTLLTFLYFENKNRINNFHTTDFISVQAFVFQLVHNF